ncbi:MAG: hypothetical protein ACPIOQ_64230, partial [Promethearchaeia archaeon]
MRRHELQRLPAVDSRALQGRSRASRGQHREERQRQRCPMATHAQILQSRRLAHETYGMAHRFAGVLTSTSAAGSIRC